MILSCPRPCAVAFVFWGSPGHLLGPNRLTHQGHPAQLLVFTRGKGTVLWGYEPVKVRG